MVGVTVMVEVSADPRVNGHAALAPSSYLQYLPAPYHEDPFLARFLLIFESILEPIERTIDNLRYYFDPRVAPEEFLAWLASWVGVELDEHWTLSQQRELIAQAALLHRWRGTRRGLREHVRLYVGRPPLIVENFDGFRLGQDAMLGVTTRLGEQQPHTIAVTVLAEDPQCIDEQVVRRIIESQKPAHVAYTLRIHPIGTAVLPRDQDTSE